MKTHELVFWLKGAADLGLFESMNHTQQTILRANLMTLEDDYSNPAYTNFCAWLEGYMDGNSGTEIEPAKLQLEQLKVIEAKLYKLTTQEQSNPTPAWAGNGHDSQGKPLRC